MSLWIKLGVLAAAGLACLALLAVEIGPVVKGLGVYEGEEQQRAHPVEHADRRRGILDEGVGHADADIGLPWNWRIGPARAAAVGTECPCDQEVTKGAEGFSPQRSRGTKKKLCFVVFVTSFLRGKNLRSLR